MSDEKVRAEDFRLVPRTGDLYRVCDLLEVTGRVLCEIRDLLEPREESVPTPAASENVSFCSDVRPRYWMVGTLDSGVMGRALPDGESEVMEPTTAVDLLNELSEPAASDAGEGDAALMAQNVLMKTLIRAFVSEFESDFVISGEGGAALIVDGPGERWGPLVRLYEAFRSAVEDDAERG